MVQLETMKNTLEQEPLIQETPIAERGRFTEFKDKVVEWKKDALQTLKLNTFDKWKAIRETTRSNRITAHHRDEIVNLKGRIGTEEKNISTFESAKIAESAKFEPAISSAKDPVIKEIFERSLQQKIKQLDDNIQHSEMVMNQMHVSVDVYSTKVSEFQKKAEECGFAYVEKLDNQIKKIREKNNYNTLCSYSDKMSAQIEQCAKDFGYINGKIVEYNNALVEAKKIGVSEEDCNSIRIAIDAFHTKRENIISSDAYCRDQFNITQYWIKKIDAKTAKYEKNKKIILDSITVSTPSVPKILSEDQPVPGAETEEVTDKVLPEVSDASNDSTPPFVDIRGESRLSIDGPIRNDESISNTESTPSDSMVRDADREDNNHPSGMTDEEALQAWNNSIKNSQPDTLQTTGFEDFEFPDNPVDPLTRHLEIQEERFRGKNLEEQDISKESILEVENRVDNIKAEDNFESISEQEEHEEHEKESLTEKRAEIIKQLSININKIYDLVFSTNDSKMSGFELFDELTKIKNIADEHEDMFEEFEVKQILDTITQIQKPYSRRDLRLTEPEILNQFKKDVVLKLFRRLPDWLEIES